MLSVCRKRKLHVFAGIIVLLLLLLVRLPLRIVVPCEVIPHKPLVVAAPLDGVIEKLVVEPGDTVKTGDLLFMYDPHGIKEECEVSQKQVTIIRKKLKQAHMEAFDDDEARATVSILEQRLEQERVRLEYARARVAKLEVRATRPGLVRVDDPEAWRGRPVTLGQRVMRIVDPEKTRVRIWIPESDNIAFARDASASILLNVDPSNRHEARLQYVSIHVSPSPRNMLAFVAEASWKTTQRNMKIGLTGSAIIYGKRVSLIYWLGRKPLLALRQLFGL